MPKVRVHSFAMSLDGYVAGPDQSLDNPHGYECVELVSSPSVAHARFARTAK